MRLYAIRGDVPAVTDPEYGHFTEDEEGYFDFPDELSDRLCRFAHRRRKIWETQEERDARLHGQELARRRDPESLYTAVAGMAELTKKLAGMQLDGRPAAEDPGVAALAEQVRALTARLAELEGQSSSPGAREDSPQSEAESPGGSPSGGEAPAKAPRAPRSAKAAA